MLEQSPAYRVPRTLYTALRAFRRYRPLVHRGRAGGSSTQEAWSRAHEQTAQELHDLTVELQGLFIKLCQVIGARGDIVPEPYTRILGRFYDRVPPRPFRRLVRGIERDLGRRIDEVFADVDETPLASASLAQVHRAELHDGRQVVLKIQYPEIGRLIRVDLATVRWIAGRIPVPESFVDASELLDELTHALALELDFAHEARASERIRKAFAGDDRVRVPRVYPEYTSGRLIVQEYLDGLPVTDIDGLRENGVDLSALAERVAAVFTAMIFGEGLFHADPHPGNLLVLPGGVLGLVDFGLAAELPENFGRSMAAMITKTWAGDSEAALAAARDLGFNIDELSPALLRALVARTMSGRGTPQSDRSRGPSRERQRQAHAERDRLNRLAEGGEKLVIPPYFALVGRTVMLLGGLFHSLAPDDKLMERTFRQALMQYAAESGA